MVELGDMVTRDGSAGVVSKRWLKASHMETAESKSKPYQSLPLQDAIDRAL